MPAKLPLQPSALAQRLSRFTQFTQRLPTPRTAFHTRQNHTLTSAHAPLPKRRTALSHARAFTTTSRTSHGDLQPPKAGEERHVTFVEKDGSQHTFEVADGDNLLDIAQAKDLEMEGACGGSCACSTCHVIVEGDEWFDKMEEPSDDENDMLDLAFGLTETSRLGCQVVMSKELDGLVVRLPSAVSNMSG
ncbi:hypothetical protein MBLNU230_g4760t2 [Neophaeotheca triangularis]